MCETIPSSVTLSFLKGPSLAEICRRNAYNNRRGKWKGWTYLGGRATEDAEKAREGGAICRKRRKSVTGGGGGIEERGKVILTRLIIIHVASAWNKVDPSSRAVETCFYFLLFVPSPTTHPPIDPTSFVTRVRFPKEKLPQNVTCRRRRARCGGWKRHLARCRCRRSRHRPRLSITRRREWKERTCEAPSAGNFRGAWPLITRQISQKLPRSSPPPSDGFSRATTLAVDRETTRSI